MRDLLSRAWTVCREEGVVSLPRRALAALTSRLYGWDRYYLFTFELERIGTLNEADFTPRIGEFTFREVLARDLADELEARGATCPWMARQFQGRAASEAIAFTTYVGDEPAHIMWVAMRDEDKACMKQPPFKVHFRDGEFCTASWSNPKYRRSGFARYTAIKALLLLKDRGLVRNRYVVAKGNTASFAAFEPFGGRRYAEGLCVRVLWWRFWSERPID